MKFILSCALALSSLPAIAAPVAQSQTQSKVYAVVFKVTPDGTGGIKDLQVERVIDPSGSGTPEEVAKRPINIEVPSTYISAARVFLEGRERARISNGGEQKVYYTYTFYDPSQPTRADLLTNKD